MLNQGEEHGCRQQIKIIIARCSGQEHKLINNHSLLAMDLYIDSLIMTEIIYETELEFGVLINDSDMENIEQVVDFYQLVEGKISTL